MTADQETVDARKVAFKAKLLVEQLGFTAARADAFAGRVHMIKAARQPSHPHRIQCGDGSWIEIDHTNNRVRTWGGGRTAREIAHDYELNEAPSTPWQVEDLVESATAAAPGAPRRARPVLPDDKLKEIADLWRKRGFSDVEMDDSGVWITLEGGTRLYDIGNRVTIYGPVTDEAISAMVGKSMAEWDGQLRLFGAWSETNRAEVWMECQRQGVALAEYVPSPELVARWEAERDAKGRSTGQVMRPAGSLIPPSSPVPTSGATAGLPNTPAEPAQVDADSALTRNLDRAQFDLEALYERWSREARTEEDRVQLRREESALCDARNILEAMPVSVRTSGSSPKLTF